MTTKKCRHSWDLSTTVWTKEGQRATPCKKCPELLIHGSVKVKESLQ